MWRRVEQLFADYLNWIKDHIEIQKAENYIEPQVCVGGDDTKMVGLNGLRKKLHPESGDKNGVVVVQGDAGVGKTALTTKIAGDLIQSSQRKFIPLLILGSENWRELIGRVREITNLGEILMELLKASTAHGGIDFPLQEPEQFTRIWQLGYFTFIFDGFDELTKSGEAMQLTPQDNINWLIDLSKNSNARILLTSRPSFWKREISEESDMLHIFDLKLFTSENVKSYFDGYFHKKGNGNPLAKKAKDIYN